jgi:hypothetical protein
MASGDGPDGTGVIKNNSAGTRGALIESQNVFHKKEA